MAVVGILLAAGRSARFGSDKLLAKIRGEYVGVLACRRMLEAIPHVQAVVRPHDDVLKAALESAGACVIECAEAADGMGASIACGVRSTVDTITIDTGGWVVALADMPWIQSDTIARVATAIDQGAAIAAPFYDGRRGHPVGFASSYAGALLALRGDEGAKHVLAQNESSIVRIDVADAGVLQDVDLPEDLRGRRPGAT